MSPDGTYSIGELADLAEVTPRTVRYYVAQGLLPAPSGAGAGARYDEDHLRRLRLIRHLQAEHLPLAEIRRRLESMTSDEIEAVIARQPQAPSDSALDYVDALLGRNKAAEPPAAMLASLAASPGPAPGSLLKRIESGPVVGSITSLSSAPAAAEASPPRGRSQWDRIQLDPDIELHVRRPLSRIQNKKVERLIELARQILQEDPS